jgi:hypothetical protein
VLIVLLFLILLKGELFIFYCLNVVNIVNSVFFI